MKQTCDLEVGGFVRNGSKKPGQIIKLIELKPGYPKAIVWWEGETSSKIENREELKSIDNWALQWQWLNGKYIRLHDKKECFDLKAMLDEIKRCHYYRQKFDADNLPDRAKAYEEKITYLKKLKLRSIKIDPQFKALIPPLTEEQELQLEDNLIKDGCRDALVIWRNLVIDGHHRLKLCKKNGLDFNLYFMDFEDRREVHDWIIRNQLGKHNLSQEAIDDLRGQLYNSRKSYRGSSNSNRYVNKKTMEVIKEKDPNLQNGVSPRFEDESTEENLEKGLSTRFEEKENVAQELADEFGINEKTVREHGKFSDSLNAICYNFGQEWRSRLVNSKLNKKQTRELGKYADNEEFRDEIEAILNDIEHKQDFNDNYQIFKNKINPQRFTVGQLVKIQFTHKSGLTEVQKHCDREFALIIKVMEFTYDLKLLKNRTFQAKQEDLIAVDFAEYSLSFSPEEFDRLCPHFESGREIEEAAKRKLLINR